MPTPRKPTRLKVAQGTYRKDRDGKAPELEPVSEIPEPPDWLPNPFAVQEFERLAEVLHAQGLLSESSIIPLAHLASLHGKLVQLWMAGCTPQASLVSAYRGLVTDFGLTPAALTRVRPSNPKNSGNAFTKNGRRPPK